MDSLQRLQEGRIGQNEISLLSTQICTYKYSYDYRLSNYDVHLVLVHLGDLGRYCKSGFNGLGLVRNVRNLRNAEIV
jgi:hypothetical protein